MEVPRLISDLKLPFALGCAGLSFDGGGAALMAEVPHLLSVPNGLADWDETKGGRSMSQGQTRKNGSWMLARSNGCVGRSRSDQEAQSNGGVDWSCDEDRCLLG